MKVAVVSPSVNGAMGDYTEGLVTALSEKVDTHLFAAEHYGRQLGLSTPHFFPTGRTRKSAMLSLLNLSLGLEIWKNIKSIAPDLVHLVNAEGYPWGLLWSYLAKRDKIPMLVTVHDPEPHPGISIDLVTCQARKFTLHQSSGIHILAACFTRSLEDQGFPRAKIFYAPHGSIAERFLGYRKSGIQRENLVIFFGRLEPYKGIDLLVEAALYLSDEFRFVIAGPGSLPKPLQEKIESYPNLFELHNRFLPEEEVSLLFQRAAVCVLPYKQATQSSLPLISAAFGTPIVATAVGGLKEDIPAVNGILVPPNDPLALARGIREAVSHAPVYPDEYRFEAIAEKFVSIYEDIAYKAAYVSA
jgi:glycosyltransferase involved in cell wall biosynthesis